MQLHKQIIENFALNNFYTKSIVRKHLVWSDIEIKIKKRKYVKTQRWVLRKYRWLFKKLHWRLGKIKKWKTYKKFKLKTRPYKKLNIRNALVFDNNSNIGVCLLKKLQIKNIGGFFKKKSLLLKHKRWKLLKINLHVNFQNKKISYLTNIEKSLNLIKAAEKKLFILNFFSETW